MAGISINVSGTWQTLKTVAVNVGGTWQTVKSVWMNVGGTWQRVFNSILTAIASPTSVSGTASGTVVVTVVSSATTVTVTGGTPGYTYSWALVSGNALTITSPSSATTTFSRSMSGNTSVTAVYRCTVHDAVGSTATADVSVELDHNNTQ